jgi:hypothetical protein
LPFRSGPPLPPAGAAAHGEQAGVHPNGVQVGGKMSRMTAGFPPPLQLCRIAAPHRLATTSMSPRPAPLACRLSPPALQPLVRLFGWKCTRAGSPTTGEANILMTRQCRRANRPSVRSTTQQLAEVQSLPAEPDFLKNQSWLSQPARGHLAASGRTKHEVRIRIRGKSGDLVLSF